jgi:hypothetical protein
MTDNQAGVGTDYTSQMTATPSQPSLRLAHEQGNLDPEYQPALESLVEYDGVLANSSNDFNMRRGHWETGFPLERVFFRYRLRVYAKEEDPTLPMCRRYLTIGPTLGVGSSGVPS